MSDLHLSALWTSLSRRLDDNKEYDHNVIREQIGGIQGVYYQDKSLLEYLPTAVMIASRVVLSYRLLLATGTSQVLSIILVSLMLQEPPALGAVGSGSEGQ